MAENKNARLTVDCLVKETEQNTTRNSISNENIYEKYAV